MQLDPKVFEAPIRKDLFHTVIVAQLAGERRGTVATKNRSLVSGGGRKPYRQKGTGRARQGSSRAGQFTGGGTVFGPQPRSYAQRVPKKVRRAALRSALSLRKSEDRLKLVDSFEIAEAKTKHVVQKLAGMGVSDVLIVTAEHEPALELAARNIPTVLVRSAAAVNVRDVLGRENLIMTNAAVEAVVERLR